jgi:pimeloyl-ACP methyl ester carboxylesterase
LLVHGHFDLVRDLPYGSDARQRLDVYRPRSSARPAPVVVFLYGSRWQHGSKGEYRLLGDALTGRGIVAVVPDYRLYPEVRFPAWVEDAARAVRWVRDSIGRFGGDPTRIFVVGHSSGGHTAAVLALDEHYLRDAGVPAEAVRGFVSIAGPVKDFFMPSSPNRPLRGSRTQGKTKNKIQTRFCQKTIRTRRPFSQIPYILNNNHFRFPVKSKISEFYSYTWSKMLKTDIFGVLIAILLNVSMNVLDGFSSVSRSAGSLV